MHYVDCIERFRASCEQEKKDQRLMKDLISKYQEKLLYRNSELFHFTSAAFVVNKEYDKLLMVHHNLYNSWSWPGGHADGNSDLLQVAMKEVKEETGVTNLELVELEPISIDILTTSGHIKNNKYISGHLHLNVSFLLKADEKEMIRIKADENSQVKWISIYEVENHVTDTEMQFVCKKTKDKIQKQ